MQSRKNKKSSHSKRENKLIKLIDTSDSEDDNEHELSFYLNDRVKLMKEVLKIIKPKKIKSMAPECIRNFDIEEINSMLLEELLGISNKRLKYIFNGQNLDEDSSSTDPEEDKQPIDIISLDDISDDDFVIDVDSGHPHSKIHNKIKEEPKKKKIKREKSSRGEKQTKNHDKSKTDEENLMSVLELLELQARARAIRSQLTLENSNKNKESELKEASVTVDEESDNEDAIIIESPHKDEIIISSDSDTDNKKSVKSTKHISVVETITNTEDIDINNSFKCNSKTDEMDKVDEQSLDGKREETITVATEPNADKVVFENEDISSIPIPCIKVAQVKIDVNEGTDGEDLIQNSEERKSDDKTQFEGDGIVINVDQSEIDCIISD